MKDEIIELQKVKKEGRSSDTEEGTNTNRRLQTDGSSKETGRKNKIR